MKKIGLYTFLFLSLLIFGFPFYFLLVSATNTSTDVVKGVLVPGNNLIENFKMVTNSYNLGQAMFNSAKISVLQTIISLIIASLAGYGFEIHKSKGKEIVFNILLLSMMIPCINT